MVTRNIGAGRPFSFKMPEETAERLGKIADAESRSIGWIIRAALDLWLDTYDAQAALGTRR